MSVLVNFRIDKKLKENVDKVCRELGITMSAAFNMFARNLVKNKNINFSTTNEFNSGFNIGNLFNTLDDIGIHSKKTKKNVVIDDNYFVNKVGNIIMLVPKGDPWENIITSAGKMSDDFMVERNQSKYEERAVL